MELTPAVLTASPIEQLVEMTLATCISPHTRSSYRMHLLRFIKSGRPLTREGVAEHYDSFRAAGKGQSTILMSRSAICKLANEAYVRGLITFETFHSIDQIDAGKYQRSRSGNWLTVTQVEHLLSLPDRSDYWGKRDACVLSTLVGCGLRRAEMATLPWSCYQQRDGRMCLVDFTGKGNKRRTVPVPSWAQTDIDAWRIASREPAPPPFYLWEHARAKKPTDHTRIAGGISDDNIAGIVELYGQRMGLDLNPHDCRRTLAQMLRRAGAPLEQIQYTLGHADISTTVQYLGSQLELAPGKAAVDMIGVTNNKPKPGNYSLTPEDGDKLYNALERDRRAVRSIQTDLKRQRACNAQ